MIFGNKKTAIAEKYIKSKKETLLDTMIGEIWGCDYTIKDRNVYLTVDVEKASSGNKTISTKQIARMASLKNLCGCYDDRLDTCSYFLMKLIKLCTGFPKYNFYVSVKENTPTIVEPKQTQPVDYSKHVKFTPVAMSDEQRDNMYKVSFWNELAHKEMKPFPASATHDVERFQVTTDDENKIKHYKWIDVDQLTQTNPRTTNTLIEDEVIKYIEDGVVYFAEDTDDDVYDYIMHFLSNGDKQAIFNACRSGYEVELGGFNKR